MKTIARTYTYTGVAVVAWCLLAGDALAGPPVAATDVLITTASIAQAGRSDTNSKDARKEAAKYLRRARQAMAENDLEAADALISKAEAVKARYGIFYVGDTPKKARKDLQRKRGAARKSPTPPSKRFAPNLMKKAPAPKTDPFAVRKTGSPSDVYRFGSSQDMPSVAAGFPKSTEVTVLPPVGSHAPAGSDRSSTSLSPFGRKLSEAPPAMDDLPLPAVLRPGQTMASSPRAVAPPSSPRAVAPPSSPRAVAPPSSPRAAAPPSSDSASLVARQRVVELTRQARAALNAGQFDRAEALAREAEELRVPETAFAPGEDRPGLVLLDIRVAGQRNSSQAVSPDGRAVTAATGVAPFNRTASHAIYHPWNDPTRNILAAAGQPIVRQDPRQLDFAQRDPRPAPIPNHPAAPLATDLAGPAPPGRPGPIPIPPQTSTALSLFRQGEEALKAHDATQAYQLFQRAAANMNQLDAITARRLQEYLQMLSVRSNKKAPTSPAGSVADEAAARQNALMAQLLADVANQEAKAKAMLAEDPQGAIRLLEEARAKIEKAALEPSVRQRLLVRIDRAFNGAQQYIEQHRPLIELKENNERTRDEIRREQRLKLENQEKLAILVDEFQKAVDEERYVHAAVVAKRARELAPSEPVVINMNWLWKFLQRKAANDALIARKEGGFLDAMRAVDIAGIAFDDYQPYRFPDAKIWAGYTTDRKKWLERGRWRTKREIEIEQKLKTPVSLSFNNEPLSNVLDQLARLAAVNLFLDPQGLAEEGVSSNTPVNIEVRQEIMLKSALNLILEPLRLSYVVKDEVLKITSEQMRDGEVYTVSYNVADLVIPIPNFRPSTNMGLAGAYHNALRNVGFGGAGQWGGGAGPLAVLASNDGRMNSGAINPELLAQVSRSGSAGMTGMPMGFGPGGLGGGAQADFDSLTDLIIATIQPTTWDDAGGVGSIEGFEINLSLVVSQTQDVHEEIADLLVQLRKLQDLQVTIEVRFITLNDNFFERIGVDFDFDIDDNIDRPFQVWGRKIEDDGAVDVEPDRDVRDVDGDRSVKVGLAAPGVFSADLDIPFSQNSFGLAIPQFGGFDASAGASLGFAILSDIEAFFFINAAHGDRRSNVLQAPKVTLFNGQQAFVSDTSQSPFVISVIPVVGDFAAAQQPVIVVLTEGTFMTVQAVVSHDKRFVRLTVVPFFSKIEEVKTFQFEGGTTTTTDTSVDNEGWINLGDADDPDWRRTNDSNANDNTVTTRGTTVQLPTFSFVTVTTTVSVPDGGTVLLGGIKRLSEGRNEFGTPILNKIPYINRLFKNVGIGRETQSLMMMVTPRIIIQEEEEEKLGILPP